MYRVAQSAPTLLDSDDVCGDCGLRDRLARWARRLALWAIESRRLRQHGDREQLERSERESAEGRLPEEHLALGGDCERLVNDNVRQLPQRAAEERAEQRAAREAHGVCDAN